MKRLRVVLVCLIVALLCWNPSHHVYCSEQSASGPGQSAGNTDPDGQETQQEQDLAQQKVEDEGAIHTLHKVGLETERASLEEPSAHDQPPEQNVNSNEAEGEENRTDPVSDPSPVAAEPEPLADPHADEEPQPEPLDEPQEVPKSPSPAAVLAPVHTPSEAPVPAESPSDSEPTDPPSLEADQSTPPHEAENTPTSETGSPPQPTR